MTIPGQGFSLETERRILKATRVVEMTPPQNVIPRRRWPVGGVSGGGGSPWFWALLDGYQFFQDVEDNIYAYTWDEAVINCDGTASVKDGGMNSGNDDEYTIHVSFYDQAKYGPSGSGVPYAALTSPENLETVIQSGGEAEVTLEWDGGAGNTRWWIYVGDTAPSNHGDSAAKNIADSGNLTSATYTATLPADDSTFYITIFASPDGTWNSDSAIRYECSITAPLSKYAITELEINQLAQGTLGNPLNGGDKPTMPDNAVVEITTPILVRMWAGQRVGCADDTTEVQYFFDAGGGAVGVTECWELFYWDENNPPTLNSTTCELEGPTVWFRFANGLLVETSTTSEPTDCP